MRLEKPIFERAYREYGVPRAIRTDNGVPFATASIRGLSFYNVTRLQLGIMHQRIRPASPREIGAHEHMNRMLERQAITPVRQTCAAQQRHFRCIPPGVQRGATARSLGAAHASVA